MKKFNFLFCISFLLFSCTNDQSSNTNQTPSPIEGTWALVSISGSFAPTINFNPDWITYHFGQNLTVQNNNPSQTVQSDGPETGSYSYTFVENSTICNEQNYHKLSISNFITNHCIKIEGNEMIIDTGLASDGLLYRFERINYNPECFSQVAVATETVEVPETGQVNQNIAIPMSFIVTDGCGGFGYVAETNSNNVKILKPYARYQGCSYCTLAIFTINFNYNFTPTTTGNQIIKIEQPDGSYITNSILIQ